MLIIKNHTRTNPSIGEKLADNPKMVATEAVCAVTTARITLKTKLEKTYCIISIFSKKVSIELGESSIYCFQ